MFFKCTFTNGSILLNFEEIWLTWKLKKPFFKLLNDGDFEIYEYIHYKKMS